MSQAQDIVLPKKLFPFIMRFIKKYGWFFIIYQILCLSLALENTLWPYVFGQLIDKLSSFPKSSGDIWHYIRPEILMVISLFLLFSIMNRGSGLIYSFLYPKFEASIRMDMFKYVQDHSYKFFSDNLAGKVANKIADMPRSVNVAIDLVFTIFIPTLLAIISSLGIFFILIMFFR